MRVFSGALLCFILAASASASACRQAYPEQQAFESRAESSATEYAGYSGGFGDTALAPVPVVDEERPAIANPLSASRSLPVDDERCDPNYEPCVPIASDVDCAGGGGNGPAYVRGPVRVIGRDRYQLDRDGDGIACDR